MLLFLFLATCSAAYAQTEQAFDSAQHALNQKKMTQESYLSFIDSLVVSSYSVKSLPEYLLTYKSIVDKTSNKDLRNKQYFAYYTHLMRYAVANNMPGLAVYYAQKREPYSIDFLTSKQTSFTAAAIEAYMYAGNSNFSACIGVKNSNLKDIQAVIQKCARDSFHYFTLKNLSVILMTSSISYANLKQCKELKENAAISSQLLQNVSKNPFYKKYLTNVQANHYTILYSKFMTCGQRDSAHAMLSAIQQLCSTPDSTELNWKALSMNSVLADCIDYFIEDKNADSARYYIDRYIQII